MTTGSHPWLPSEALADGTLERLLQEPLEAWAKKWLTTSPVFSVTQRPLDRSVTAVGSRLQITHAPVEMGVSVSHEDGERFGSRMIGYEQAEKGIAVSDAQLFNALSKEVFCDLAQTIWAHLAPRESTEFGIAEGLPRQNDGNHIEFCISAQSGRLDIFVNISVNRLAEARLRHLPEPLSRAPLSSIQDALQKQRLRLGGYVGAANIELSALRDLDVDDVIVLDGMMSKPMDATLEGKPLRNLSCHLAGENDSLVFSKRSPDGAF